MPTFMYRGVKVNCNQPLNHPDLGRAVHLAWTDLTHLRRFNENDVKVLNRRSWGVSEFEGVPLIQLRLPPMPAVPMPPPKPIFKDPLQRYLPAFHAFDKDKNFRGLVICMSGLWGPPYRYMKCTEEELLNFEDGQWNTEEGMVRPDPEVYKETRLKSFIYSGVEETYYDLPASHDYCSEDAYTYDYDRSFYNEFLAGEPNVVVVVCDMEGVDSVGYTKIAINIRSETVYQSRIVLRTDFEVYAEDSPNVMLEYIVGTKNVDREVCGAAGGSTTYPYHCPEMIADMQGHCDTTEWEGFFGNSYTFDEWSIVGGPIWYSEIITAVGNYLYSGVYWSTYIGETLDKGVLLYGTTIRSSYSKHDHIAEMTPEIATNFQLVYDNLDSSNSYIGKDIISVFGKPYVLKEFPGAYDTAVGKLTDAWPRIYEVNNSDKIVLAATLRRSTMKFEYMRFSEGIEQYNDPAATYDAVVFSGTSDRFHKIGVQLGEYDEIELYGKGEFSLLKSRRMPTPWPAGETKDDREDTKYTDLQENVGNLDLLT